MKSYIGLIGVGVMGQSLILNMANHGYSVSIYDLNQKKQNKENHVMKDLAKRFIGEECIIYTVASDSGSIQGVIKEVADGGMIIDRKSGEREIINLDFVTRIRQYPRKKNGKKKDVVLD